MAVESASLTKAESSERRISSAVLRLTCLPAGTCYVCGQQMVRGSGGKWLCKSCGFLLTCCDP